MIVSLRTALVLAVLLALAAPALADPCVDCHAKVTPGAVADWKLSRHFSENVDCATCHGEEHHDSTDVAKAKLPAPELCGQCHPDRLKQFQESKHAKAWVAMNAMPSIHWQPMAMTEGMKGCGGCHKLGLKGAAEQRQLAAEGSSYGNASCDACHTRHTFSAKEAREPQACMTCHMGFDHPQWEMYSSSKHGARYQMKQLGVLAPEASAPTCQDCHMPGGDHAVKTSWGFLAVRLPMPDDKQWADDRATILQGLGVLGLDGKPTARLAVVQAGDVARLDQESWQKPREKMIAACARCHSASFAKQQLERGDDMIRDADHLMAEAIRIVGALYQDGVLAKPATYADAFPDLLTFHDAPTVIEQKLFVMFLEHRMRTFQGTFHASPDYAMWYGWSEMRRDLTEIRELAVQMRRDHAADLQAAPKGKAKAPRKPAVAREKPQG